MSYDLEKDLGLVPELHPIFKRIDDEEPLSPEKIADMLGVSKETVRRWCRSGILPNYNFGGKYVIIGSDFKNFMRKSKSRKKMEGKIAR